MHIILTEEDGTSDCTFLDYDCYDYIEKYCSPSTFFFPAILVVYGEVYLVYRLNNQWATVVPLYVYYNSSACRLLYRVTFLLGLIRIIW